ncbi:MAG TPA: undecaprenyl-phosphate glucose phosphotransferase [Sandaracinaceae bacterium LLY-WYZ-13_1]|nr:undecaprenyl-phosphate glucose phosphotransferase [Sandaracinaceae bacterium LLY-WYZ-13_1]
MNHGLIRPYGTHLAVLERLIDAAWIAGAYAALVAVYGGHEWSIYDTLPTGAGASLFVLLADGNGLYQATRGSRLRDEIRRIWTSWVLVIPVILAGVFVAKITPHYSRMVTGSWFLLAPVTLSAWRALQRLALRELRRRGRNSRKVAIAGLTEMSEQLARRVHNMPWLGLVLDGVYDDRGPERTHSMPEDVAHYAGRFDELVEKTRDGTIDIVYVTLPLRAENRIRELTDRLADSTAEVYLVPDFYVFDLLHGSWSTFDDIPVVSIFETPFYGVDGWVKRAEDVILGSLFVLLASVPMLLIALAIKLTSKGPVFFRQRRYGLRGEVIEILKFRSMTVAEDGDQVAQATKDDARVTKVGKLLRRTSLDELPQLLHVVTGKMSLVGPRPHAVAHNELYRRQISHYMLRHKVKPGLTGWAQVNGWRGETDTLEKMQRRIEHDLEYIHKWSLWLDVEIIFLTVFGRAVHRNAY